MPKRLKLALALLFLFSATNIVGAIYALIYRASDPEARMGVFLSILIGTSHVVCALGLMLRKQEARLCGLISFSLPLVFLTYLSVTQYRNYHAANVAIDEYESGFLFGYVVVVSSLSLIAIAGMSYLLFNSRTRLWLENNLVTEEHVPSTNSLREDPAVSFKIILLCIAASVLVTSILTMWLQPTYREMFSDHNSRLPSITEFILNQPHLFLLASGLIPLIGLFGARNFKRRAANILIGILALILIAAGIVLAYGLGLPLTRLDSVTATG
jgi:hypothetical protein